MYQIPNQTSLVQKDVFSTSNLTDNISFQVNWKHIEQELWNSKFWNYSLLHCIWILEPITFIILSIYHLITIRLFLSWSTNCMRNFFCLIVNDNYAETTKLTFMTISDLFLIASIIHWFVLGYLHDTLKIDVKSKILFWNYAIRYLCVLIYQ